MKYILLANESPEAFAVRSDPDPARQGEYWAAWLAYGEAIAGVNQSGAALETPDTGTTVQLRNGERHVQDGPYPESKEALGGFFIIDVPDLDTALEWAAKCPAAAAGTVEVRPVLEMG